MTKQQASGLIGLLVIVVAVLVWLLMPVSDPASEDPVLTYGDFNALEVVSAPPSPSEPESVERPSLTERSQTASSRSFMRLADEFRVEQYRLYQCPDSDTVAQQVLSLTAISKQTDQGYSIAAAQELVRDWEPNMYEDLGSIIYTDIDRAESVIFPAFQDIPGTTMRRSTTTVSGQERTITYDWHYNILLLGGSARCVQEVKFRLQGA